MKTKPLIFLLALTFLFLFSGSVFGGDYEDGRLAIIVKRYKIAYKLWLPLAEQGDAKSQYALGQLYYSGQGVPQDYKQAFKWFQLAAEQEFAPAQYNLGVMYTNGQGVPKDSESAHMWFNVAASNGNKDAVKNRNMLVEQMTPQQIEKAQEMARNWKPKK